MKRWPAPAALAAAFLAIASGPALAEIVRHADFCPADPPLRQTTVIVDDSLVHRSPPGAPLPPENVAWIEPVRQIADVEVRSLGTMMPGEHLSVFVARRDTAELVPVFFGCSPNLSGADSAALEEDQSFVSKLIFGETTGEERRKDFLDALGDAFGLIIREDREPPPGDGDAAGFLRVLASTPSLYSLDNGIPRVLLITPFAAPAGAWRSVEDARRQGFAMADDLKVDFKLAEVYVVATQAGAEHAQDFADAYLLGSRARLAGWRKTGLPPVENPPAQVAVYGGAVDIAGIESPVQIRLAVDRQGSLVNSWIELTRIATAATPVTGKMICADETDCEVKGDGRLFAQAWSVTPLETRPGAQTMFDQDLAWSGFRHIEIGIEGERAEAWIFEPNVVMEVGGPEATGKKTLNGYRVPATLARGQHF
ncbi:hypothetical protein [Bauldia litoralis]|uniref:hypothetical protein n=1 Tax=Bauldia litoralis TaxID=665467 RepID=UPI003262DCD3